MNTETMNNTEEDVLVESEPVLKPSTEASKLLENRFLSMDIGEAMELFTRVYGSSVETIFEESSLEYKEKTKLKRGKNGTEDNLIEVAESLNNPVSGAGAQTDSLYVATSESQLQDEYPPSASIHQIFELSEERPEIVPALDVKNSIQPQNVLDASMPFENQILEMLIEIQREVQDLRSSYKQDIEKLQEEVNEIKNSIAAFNIPVLDETKVDQSPIEQNNNDSNVAVPQVNPQNPSLLLENDNTINDAVPISQDLKSVRKSRQLLSSFLKWVSILGVYAIVMFLIIGVVYNLFHFVTQHADVSANKGQVSLTTNQDDRDKVSNSFMDMFRNQIKTIQTFWGGISENAKIKITPSDISPTAIPTTPVPDLTRSP